MAIDLGSETQTVSKQERTYRVVIDTTLNTDPTITVYREQVITTSDASARTLDKILSRNLSLVASQSFTVNGQDYTTTEIAEVIAAIADTWAQE